MAIEAGGEARLSRAFYAGPTLTVARRLLGCFVCHRVDGRLWRGRIVEVEAYTDDAASHAAGGRRTPRNAVMFGPPGVAYVYFTYGMHHCFNVVTESDGRPGAVLVRGLDGLPGAGGPALACRALGLGRPDSGRDLVTDPNLWVEAGRRRRGERIVRTSRVGIRRAVELPLRLYLLGSPGVSRRDRLAEGAALRTGGP
ncbi:DNA-3-methyladenine glycosylase [Candidatus Binatia bacterium]|nr:DNA-3-methyladenine glycosylase [Candidatus Binatia bacterium]